MSNAALNVAKTSFDPKTGMNAEARKKVARALGHVLADSYQLFIKTQGTHWNLAGPSFYGLHKLTEAQYEDLYAAIDEIAERIRALGEKAPASYTTYGELSSIKDEDRPATTSAMIEMLVRDNRIIAKTLRDAIHVCEESDDVVTADQLTGRLARHEQNTWMLSVHLAE